MNFRILAALLGILAGSAALASCASDTTRVNQPNEAGNLQRQANACGENAAELTPELAELFTEKGFAEKVEQAREQHQDVMMRLYEHVVELSTKHALPGASEADKHGQVTVFAPPTMGETVEKDDSSLWNDASCKKVYVVKACFESGNLLRYRFCEENSAFKLLTAAKRVDNEWVELR